MYDALSVDYDRFVNWNARLGVEMPFLLDALHSLPSFLPAPKRVLDAACGTGQHAIALAQQGFLAAGSDLSVGMVEQARHHAQQAGLDLPFVAAGFGELQAAFASSPLFPFDALLCLGNSLPHLTDLPSLQAALADFAACLRPGGLLVLQNRNFDALAHSHERWMEPQARREDDQDWVFIRFYDYLPDGLIDFHILTLYRAAPSTSWQQRLTTTRLRSLLHDELLALLAEAGFGRIRAYGDMQSAPFQPGPSGNLVVTAVKGG